MCLQMGTLALPVSQAALCITAVPLGMAVTAVGVTLQAAVVKHLAVGRISPGLHRWAFPPPLTLSPAFQARFVGATLLPGLEISR
jgi:hypothetical protein